MNAVMYIFANRGLKMSPGKLAAQVAHAAVNAYMLSDPRLVKNWFEAGHHTKIVLSADDEIQMANIEKYLTDRDLKTAQIIDEGRTEITPFSRTALGVEIVDKDDPETAKIFSDFKTYKELPPARDPRKVSGQKKPRDYALDFAIFLIVVTLLAAFTFLLHQYA